MNVLLINTADNYGGAALASLNLCRAIIGSGHNAKLLVRDSGLNLPYVSAIQRSTLGEIKDNFSHKFEYARYLFFERAENAPPLYSAARFGRSIVNNPLFNWADVIHLNWVNNSFLRLSDIEEIFRIGKPIVWHLHDLWPLTGVCHHPLNCKGFESACGNCPLLDKAKEKDRSAVLFNKKKELYTSFKPTFVLPSKWMMDMARKSGLSKESELVKIPNPIDHQQFFPRNRNEARRQLGLQNDKKYLLAGAANSKLSFKGMSALKESLKLFERKGIPKNAELLIFGKADQSWAADLKIPVKFVGYTERERLSLLYSAANVFLFPSEAESFGLTLVESMSCGTPVVSFGAGISLEVIRHQENSYLATKGNFEDFSNGIEFLLENTSRINPEELNQEIKNDYSLEVIGNKYSELFNYLV